MKNLIQNLIGLPPILNSCAPLPAAEKSKLTAFESFRFNRPTTIPRIVILTNTSSPKSLCATMKAREGLFQVRLMCRVLSVSASGYYAWRRRKPSRWSQRRLALDAPVREAFDAERSRAGAPDCPSDSKPTVAKLPKACVDKRFGPRLRENSRLQRIRHTHCRWLRIC